MNPASIAKSRGTIVKVPDATPGIVFVNGQQQYFALERIWKSAVAPAPNQAVDLEFDAAGAITSITVVDSQQQAKDRFNQFGGAAQAQGKEAAKLAQQGIGALAARMGTVPLVSAVLLWVAWFFFPAAHVGGGMLPSESYSFWTLLGIDFSGMADPMRAGSSHGLFGLLGLIAIAAPFAAPFIRTTWSHYLNAAPLGYILLAWLVIYIRENKVFSEVAKLLGENPFSFGWGLFVLAIAAAVLAAGALKKPAA
jgi:hypothetical protein